MTEEVSAVQKLDIMVDILDTQTALVTWSLGDNEDMSQVRDSKGISELPLITLPYKISCI